MSVKAVGSQFGMMLIP